jgi:preprotein translocase SecF subunit
MQGMDAIRDGLVEADPGRVGGTIEARRAVYEPMARALLDKRRELGIFSGPADIAGIPELSVAVREYLGQAGRFGEFSVLAVDNVGPTVGADLREKATYAILFSILAMLIYIAFRFHLPYGIGAIVALVHDTLVTLGVLTITGREIDITTVAALLTLVGYSVNDKVVIFDRIRERLKLERGKALVEVMNSAINQTLSRTIITGGGTLVVLISLFIFGGDVINTFSFVLLLGIIIGTYSSIYIASPVALWITNLFERRKIAKRRR